MRPRRTENTTHVYTLPGGTEDNDLWVYEVSDEDGFHVICSVWEPTHEEREQIAAGYNIRLMVWANRLPPVQVGITDERLGKGDHSE